MTDTSRNLEATLPLRHNKLKCYVIVPQQGQIYNSVYSLDSVKQIGAEAMRPPKEYYHLRDL